MPASRTPERCNNTLRFPEPSTDCVLLQVVMNSLSKWLEGFLTEHQLARLQPHGTKEGQLVSLVWASADVSALMGALTQVRSLARLDCLLQQRPRGCSLLLSQCIHAWCAMGCPQAPPALCCLTTCWRFLHCLVKHAHPSSSAGSPAPPSPCTAATQGAS